MRWPMRTTSSALPRRRTAVSTGSTNVVRSSTVRSFFSASTSCRMRGPVSLLMWFMLVSGCSRAGHGEPSSSRSQTRDPATTVPPTSAPANDTATAGSSCPPVALSLHPSEPPIDVRFKMRQTQDGEVVDKLLVSRATPELHQTLQVKDMDALSVLDKCIVRTADINFDGYADVYVGLRAGAANTYAQYWWYDPASKNFAELGEYPELQADAARKRLKMYESNGSGGREYESREYSFDGGKLVLGRREVQAAIADEDGFERTLFLRRGAEMKVVEKRRVPAGDQ